MNGNNQQNRNKSMIHQTKQSDTKRQSLEISNIRNSNNDSKKRKHPNDIHESQQKKKRKLNDNNNNKTMEQRFRELFAKNLSLSQELRRCKRERDQNKLNMDYYKKEMEHHEKEKNDYKQEMDHYRKEMSYYKDKYFNLKHNMINVIKEDDINYNQSSFVLSTQQQQHKDRVKINPNQQTQSNNNNKNEIETISTSPSPPPSHYFHKPNKKDIVSNNDCNINNDLNENEEYEDNEIELIDNDNNANHIRWENCHFISVDCKFCGKHYDDIDEYRDHLQYEYDTDPLKTWRQCNESGCDATKIYRDYAEFMSHLSVHAHQHPFHCNIKTLQGTLCTFSSSKKNGLVKHLNTRKHNINLRGKQNRNDSDYQDEDDYKWKDSHFISVNCKFCGKHYDDFDQYCDHLQFEYDNDSSKTWRQCNESGCDPTKKWRSSIEFVYHLSVHAHQHPFHCNIKTLHGTLCTFSSSQKSELEKHLKGTKHNINLKEKRNHSDYEDDDDDDDDDDDEDEDDEVEDEYDPISDINDKIESDKDYEWEDCHFISVDCKFCGKHFDSFDEYVDDLKYHFNSDESKEWLKCPESECKYRNKIFSSGTRGFVAHLCSHGHQHPFHCNDENCTVTASTKGNLINHLSSSTHQIILKKHTKTKRKKKEIKEDNYECQDNWNKDEREIGSDEYYSC